MNATICKAWTFEAAHHLPHVADGHKCKRMHGHTYRVEIELTGGLPVDGETAGMVMDYDVLDTYVRPVIDEVDHRCLNDITGLENPTTEVLAYWLAVRIREIQLEDGQQSIAGARRALPIRRIRVYESSTTWAEVRLSS